MEDDEDIQTKGGKGQEVANSGPAMVSWISYEINISLNHLDW